MFLDIFPTLYNTFLFIFSGNVFIFRGSTLLKAIWLKKKNIESEARGEYHCVYSLYSFCVNYSLKLIFSWFIFVIAIFLFYHVKNNSGYNWGEILETFLIATAGCNLYQWLIIVFLFHCSFIYLLNVFMLFFFPDDSKVLISYLIIRTAVLWHDLIYCLVSTKHIGKCSSCLQTQLSLF